MTLASRGWNMASTQDATIAELRRANAGLRRERDTARSERDAALTQRGSDFDEQAAYQAATIAVLQAMSASPGDPRPVLDLIVRQASAPLRQHERRLVRI